MRRLVVVFLCLFAVVFQGNLTALAQETPQFDPATGIPVGWNVLDEHVETCENVSTVRIAFLVEGTSLTGDADGPRYKQITCKTVVYRTNQGDIEVIEQVVSAKCGSVNLIMSVSHVEQNDPWGEAYIAYPCYASPSILPYGEPLHPFFMYYEGCFDGGSYDVAVLLDAAPAFGPEVITPYVTRQPENCWPGIVNQA